MNPADRHAPGRPGQASRWTSSAKSGIGTASNLTSQVWFTLSHGIFNEVFYPRVDLACLRDLGLVVTQGRDFFSEEKRHCRHEVTYPYEGALVSRLVNTCLQNRYRIEKTIFTNPRHHAVLQETSFTALARRRTMATGCTWWPRRIWETAAGTTPPGWASIKGCPCSSRRGEITRWRWQARRRGRPCRSVLWESRTDGRSWSARKR